MEKWLILPGVVLLIWLFRKIIRAPLRRLFRLGLNTLLGFGLLIALDRLGGYIGVDIGVNWITALTVGILGLPGLALILMLQWFLRVFC